MVRKTFFWLHLAGGLSAGTIVFIMSVTGVLLTYERQIVAWADRDLRSLPPEGAPRLPITVLLEKSFDSGEGELPVSLTVRSDPEAPASISLGRSRSLFVSPYTGESLGEGNQRVRRFFRGVTDWHRWLGASDESRPTGKAITGAANLAFLFLVGTGFYLWWPRAWKWQSLRSVVFFRRGLTGKARDFNWHNTIGFWSAAPLFVIVISGVVISYPWASDLLYRVTGSEPPARRADGPRAPANRAPSAPDYRGLDQGLEIAAAQVPGWKSITVRFSSNPEDPWSFAIDRGNGARPDLRAQVIVDRDTGEVLRLEPYARQLPAQKIRGWLRFLHTGEALGVAGQTVAGAVSLGAAFLVFTGFCLSWRRFFGGYASASAIKTAVVGSGTGARAPSKATSSTKIHSFK
jgi:uncharacterized iron-regulated membrane protein